MSQNRQLSKSSFTFKKITFRESKFLAGTSVLDTRFKHLKSQNNNPFDLFNNQDNYALAYYFTNSETIKRNVNKFFTNFLIKFITKNLLYHIANK